MTEDEKWRVKFAKKFIGEFTPSLVDTYIKRLSELKGKTPEETIGDITSDENYLRCYSWESIWDIVCYDRTRLEMLEEKARLYEKFRPDNEDLDKKELGELVKEDLKQYDQDNMLPSFKPHFINDTRGWRVYVVGDEVLGICVWCKAGDEYPGFYTLCGDDGFYWPGEISGYSTAWIETQRKCTEIMIKWLDENCEKDEWGRHKLKETKK